MSKAVKDYNHQSKGKLTRDPNGTGIYSPSGIYGDATLATRWKGEIVVQAIIRGILMEIDDLLEFRSCRSSGVAE
jgi:creatinine amidohydrolase